MLVYFALFSKIGAMDRLISPERIELESCACTQIKALEEGVGDYIEMKLGIRHKGRNAANLISDGGDLVCSFFSNQCHGSANIYRTNQARKLRLRSNQRI